MTRKTLKSDRLWKFSSAGRASALQAEGQRFEPVNFHQTSTYESKCFFFFPIAAGLVICQPAEGQKFEPCNAHRTREIRTFCQTVMGSDLLLFLWKSQKMKTGRTAGCGNPPGFLCKCTVRSCVSRFPIGERPLYTISHISFLLSATAAG